MSARVFTALYRSRCVGCDEAIVPGHDVTWVDDELVHLECSGTVEAAHRRAERPAVICPACFLTKPCGCEDPS